MKGKLMNNLKEKVNRIQELRRSNAATAIKNKKKYNRKQKYKNKFESQLRKISKRYPQGVDKLCEINHIKIYGVLVDNVSLIWYYSLITKERSTNE